jgi:hypothetical protein
MFIIAAPLVAGAWPVLSASILAAAASLGYASVRQEESSHARASDYVVDSEVDITMANSEVVSDTLIRGESFSVSKGDILATFRVDGRGACQVHVSGKGHSEHELKMAGSELMDRVRQQFAYSQVMAELEQRGFQISKQEVDNKQTIRITVTRP